ncbi:MAG TPA: ATP-dependent Clp protease ATP-binding subunit ClpX, partial [Propionicimonas sp.]
KFGLIPEFIGRLPMISTVEQLDAESLKRILVEPKNALIKQFRKLFELDGVDLEFTPEAITAIAEMALRRGIGARGLRSILEEILLNVMYHVPSDDEVAQVLVDADVVSDGVAPQLISRAQLARSERREKSA